MKIAFLSYSHVDQVFARSLAARLERAGVDLFFDEWALNVGDPLLDKIMEAIDNRDHVVALISASSVKSRWVKVELRTAFDKGDGVILPVILPGTKDEDIP